MEKAPEYSKYSLAELLEVQENIDRDRFPKRAEIVDKEIKKRMKHGEAISDKPESGYWYDEDDADERPPGLILDFQGKSMQIWRYLFLGVITFLHISALAYVYHSTQVPTLSELPEYLINVENARCKAIRSGDHRSYDLIIKSYGYNFYAIDIKGTLCRQLVKDIPKGQDVKIWHLDSIIFKMMLNGKVLLSDTYLRSHYQDNRIASKSNWLMYFVIFWIVMFKSFINAINPGTFLKDD